MHKRAKEENQDQTHGAGLVSCVVSIHPSEDAASVLFIDELHQGIQSSVLRATTRIDVDNLALL